MSPQTGSSGPTVNINTGEDKHPWWQDIVSHIGNKVGDYLINNILPGGAGGAIPMKDGGIVTKPTKALIGEAGPEAIIPLRSGRRFYGEK